MRIFSQVGLKRNIVLNARRHSWNNRCTQTSSLNHRVFVFVGKEDVCSMDTLKIPS